MPIWPRANEEHGLKYAKTESMAKKVDGQYYNDIPDQWQTTWDGYCMDLIENGLLAWR